MCEKGGTLRVDKAYDTDALWEMAAEQKSGLIFLKDPTVRTLSRSHNWYNTRETVSNASLTAPSTIVLFPHVATGTELTS